MFAYFNGKIAELSKGLCVMDINGVGWALIVTDRFASTHSVGESAKLFAHMAVKEDDISLFGFDSQAEKAMFLRLTSVSGVGPKAAMSLLSFMDTQQIASALLSADSKAFSRAPGIGAKIANRIILELKDKVDVAELTGSSVGAAGVAADAASEAVAALVSLGYQRTEAVAAVAAVKELADTAEELTLMALRRVGG